MKTKIKEQMLQKLYAWECFTEFDKDQQSELLSFFYNQHRIRKGLRKSKDNEETDVEEEKPIITNINKKELKKTIKEKEKSKPIKKKNKIQDEDEEDLDDSENEEELEEEIEA